MCVQNGIHPSYCTIQGIGGDFGHSWRDRELLSHTKKLRYGRTRGGGGTKEGAKLQALFLHPIFGMR